MHNNRSQMNVVASAKKSNLEQVGGIVCLILFNEVSPIIAKQVKTMSFKSREADGMTIKTKKCLAWLMKFDNRFAY